MGVQIYLKLHMNEARSVVHKQTTTRIHLQIGHFASRREEVAFGAADKVVNSNSLARHKIVQFQDPLAVSNNRSHLTRSWMPSLFTIKASSTLGEFFQVTNSSVEALLMFQHGKDTRSHDKEDPFEV